MKIRKEDTRQENQNQIVEWTGNTYRNFNDYVAFREGDGIFMMGIKLLLRFAGIAFMIILSPFVIVGMLIAFLAVL
jgi:hypothetical protein